MYVLILERELVVYNMLFFSSFTAPHKMKYVEIQLFKFFFFFLTVYALFIFPPCSGTWMMIIHTILHNQHVRRNLMIDARII